MARYFTFRWIRMALVGVLLALPSAPAQAQVACGPHDLVVTRLGQLFQERQTGYGLAGQAVIVEIYVSTSGTWTMLVTDVAGRSCIVAAGDGWENTVPVASKGRAA